MKRLINKLHESKFLGILFHTLIHCIQKELKDCDSVLDLGCGPSSPLQFCRNVKYSIGVEAFKPYLKKSKNKKIHTKYFHKRIEEVSFSNNSFDAVVLIEVLEHLPKEIGYQVLKKAEKWAKKKIIVTSPNGFIPQKELDNNPLQKHLSDWPLKEMTKLGFRVKGLAGLKFLRQEVQDCGVTDNLMTSVRFKPRFFWFIVATLSQILTYHVPCLSFELFSVKIKRK